MKNRRIPRFQRETVSFGVSIPKTLQIMLDAEVAAADSNRSAVGATALNSTSIIAKKPQESPKRVPGVFVFENPAALLIVRHTQELADQPIDQNELSQP